MERYPARYSDAFGVVDTSVFNDGQLLNVEIRGVLFTGASFDSLEPSDDVDPAHLETFTFSRGELCDCRLECQIPILIDDNGKRSFAALAVDIRLGKPTLNGSVDVLELVLSLTWGNQTLCSKDNGFLFENGLHEIQEQLLDGVSIRACINCRYSDYHPLGNGLFGNMLCFRNIKSEYLKVTCKEEFLSVHDRFEREVQETYLCPEFEPRVPGTGYRG